MLRVVLFMVKGKTEDDLDALASELRNDEYPRPEERDPAQAENEKQVTYKNVDVTITLKKESEKDSETDEQRTLFTDNGFELGELLYDKARKVLRVPIVLAKEMVYHYDDYDAFRPREELKAIAQYIKGVPVTRGHPAAKIVTDRDEVLGWTIDAEFEDDELRAVLEITDKNLILDIQSGNLVGVSPGHFSRLDKNASGEFEGVHFDVTQRDLFIDHIAIVEKGRCNTTDGCGVVLDEKVESTGDKGDKKKEEDEEGRMEPKAVEKKVDAALAVAEKIEKKAEEEAEVLKSIVELEEVPSAVVAKVKKAIGIAEKIGEEAKNTLKGKLEVVKTAVGGSEGEKEEVEEKEEKVDAVAAGKIAGLEAERDELKTALDEIVSAEKEKVIDELKTMQDVKPEEVLEKMSLDSLKGDLELVKALRGDKVSFDDTADEGTDSIKSAYKSVGVKGGKE